MYIYDAGCQGGMNNQSVAMQQDLYGSDHSLANENFDFTQLKSFRKDCLLVFTNALGLTEKTIMLIERQLRIFCLLLGNIMLLEESECYQNNP